MTPTQQIADSYRAAALKDAWYGPALAELLPQIPPDLAAVPAAPGTNSIAAILQHLLLWNERVRLASPENPMPEWHAEKDWSEPPIPWAELITRWNQSRDLLEARIRDFPAGDLPNQVPGRKYSYEFLFRGIVEHTIWHSGQIALLRTVLRQRSA